MPDLGVLHAVDPGVVCVTTKRPFLLTVLMGASCGAADVAAGAEEAIGSAEVTAGGAEMAAGTADVAAVAAPASDDLADVILPAATPAVLLSQSLLGSATDDFFSAAVLEVAVA